MRGTSQASRMWGAAVGVTLLLTLTACSGDSADDPTGPSFFPVPSTVEPEPSDPPSSAEPSAAATATAEALVAPELPAAATEETPEGAAAFAEWWFDTLNYATATGDTTAITATTQVETCETCRNFIDEIEVTHEGGGRFEGNQVEADVEPAGTVQDGTASFVVRLQVLEGAIVASNGTREVLTAESLVLATATVWDDGVWTMGDLRR